MHVMVIALNSPNYYNDAIIVLERYFRKYSIAYSVITQTDQNYKNAHPSWLKLICHKIVKDQDYILNWDLDLLPLKDAEDIRPYLDYSRINMAEDSSLLAGHGGFNPNFKYNGGLIGVPKLLSHWTESVYDEFAPGTWPSFEQYYLNDAIVRDKIDIYTIHPKFNTLYPMDDNGLKLWKDSVFRHYTFGCSSNLRPHKIREHRNEF